MTDREKWQQILDKIELTKESNPFTYQLWQSVWSTVKPKIEQALEASETQNP